MRAFCTKRENLPLSTVGSLGGGNHINWHCSWLRPFRHLGLIPETQNLVKKPKLLCSTCGSGQTITTAGFRADLAIPGACNFPVTSTGGTSALSGGHFTVHCCGNHSDYRCPDNRLFAYCSVAVSDCSNQGEQLIIYIRHKL